MLKATSRKGTIVGRGTFSASGGVTTVINLIRFGLRADISFFFLI